MATSSPPPSSTSTADTPASAPPSTSPPPSTTPPTVASQSPQSNATTNSTSSSPPLSSAPPPSTPSATSPPITSPPPPSVVPPNSSPPPPSVDPPSTSTSPPPPSQSPPPPSAPPPTLSPPPSNNTSTPPQTSPTPPPPSAPPPQSRPPQGSSPPPSTPPPNSPPPQSSPPPPPAVNPPTGSPPPPNSAPPPESSPPPPSVIPPNASPPPPPSVVPTAPPPSHLTPPVSQPPPPHLTPPVSQPPPPPSDHTPKSSPPPPPVAKLSPPPPSTISPTSAPSANNTAPQGSSSSSSGGIGTAGLVAIGIVVGIIMLSLAGLFLWCLRKRRKDGPELTGVYVMPSPSGSSPTSESASLKQSTPFLPSGSSSGTVYTPTEPGGLGNSRSWFTYEELVKATNGFSSQNLLGEGGFGSVYKGCLPDGRDIAVKQLKVGGGQGEREFKAEVETISRVHHRHLVSLVGYCISDNQRLLVYEYVPNNTLHFHLHGEGVVVLDWATRVKIAAGAARGIAYLHEDCHPRIIHRDIKSSNILIDYNFEAKVSDFGLAKLVDANTHVTTRVMGTFGYMAPEYASSGKLTEKSDVFSYGVVILELITGRKPVDTSQPLGDESLVEWARPLLSYALETENFDGLVDRRLENNYIESEMFRMVEVAAACVRHSAAKRPQMGQVVRAFHSLAKADLTNGMRVGESEVFNSAEQSAEVRLFRRMAFGSQNYSTDFFSQGSLGSRGNTRNSSTEQQFHSTMNSAAASQIEMVEP